jgi:hypothetical protein
MLKYTTPEAIALRLRGRLEFNQSVTGGAFGQNLGAKQVDFQLYEQVAQQVEAKLNMALSMIYELPIPLTAVDAIKILASIVEKFVVAEIASVHFQQVQSATEGGDAGFGAVMLKQAKEECQVIGINYPGIAVAPAIPFNRPEAMVLPGVRIKAEIPDIISRGYNFVVQRNPEKASSIDWGI